ncbi:MAG: hypothetical protein LC781_08895 [Actinobacteria bacterium]|nr:hypothetical protein [Actinomycetota bacterium]MCA1738127.1 hypothetical protein [Actinomycetota bacterium]
MGESRITRSEIDGGAVWSAVARRGDSLNEAFYVVVDTPEEELRDESRRRILSVLADLRDQAWHEAASVKERFGLPSS